MVAINSLIQRTQEMNRFQILPATVAVGDPFAIAAAVIEVEHRCHGIHSQPVDVIMLEPEERARHEKGTHFIAAVVEDPAVPVRVVTLPRIGMLVEMRAVEAVESVRIVRKVRRHPVEDHADAVLMQHVDEIHEILRRAVA
jgi:hypothetical protein